MFQQMSEKFSRMIIVAGIPNVRPVSKYFWHNYSLILKI